MTMINIPKFSKQYDSDAQRLVLPLLPLRDIVVFPYMVAPLFVGRKKSVNALAEAMSKDKYVFLSLKWYFTLIKCLELIMVASSICVFIVALLFEKRIKKPRTNVSVVVL